MEEEIYKALKNEEKEILAALYESKSMKALKRALELYQLKKAEWVIEVSKDHEYTVLNRGNVQGARFIFDLCQTAYKNENKKR